MKAVQLVEAGQNPRVVEIPQPAPGPGEILLKVTAAGWCHSDVFVVDNIAAFAHFTLPLTLGHEGVGIVEEVGPGVSGVEIGGAYAVYGPWGCGHCPTCVTGREQYCPNAAARGIMPPGLGSPGCLAEYVIVDSARHLVPIGDLDPVKAVPLTDAGLTPYHAIKRSWPKLVPGATAVVIGVGGLGHLAIQILKMVSPARVVALDVSEEKLALARSLGADEALISHMDNLDAIKAAAGGGAEVVIDFVGAQPTIDLASKLIKPASDLTIVGVGSGVAHVSLLSQPYGASVLAPYWGTREDLYEVVELAKEGKLDVHTEVFSLDDALAGYDKLHAGTLDGRAVVVP